MTIRNKGYVGLALLLVLLDQCTKIAVKGFSIGSLYHSGMYLGQSIPIVGETIRLTFVENPGMAFGISFGAGKIFLSLFSIAASLALLWFLTQLESVNRWIVLALALVLAGATGNLIDRVFYGVLYGENPLFYGYVVDFIDVDIPDITLFGRELTRFWVFNVADSCVTTGMTLLLIFNKHLPAFHSSPMTATEEINVAADITSDEKAPTPDANQH